MLASERVRLLKEDPWTAQGLAQELYAMFTDDTDPTDLGSGASLNYNGVTPLVINGLPNNSETPIPVLSVKKGNGAVFSMSIAGNTFIFQMTDPNGNTTTLPVGAAKSASVSATFPGQLTGYSGGNIYTVRIFPNGLGGGSLDVNARQIMGDPDFPHNVDGHVWTMVTKLRDGYYINVPVWA